MLALDLTVTERFRRGTLEARDEYRLEGEDPVLAVEQCRSEPSTEPTCSSARVALKGGVLRQLTPPDAWQVGEDRFGLCDQPLQVALSPPSPSRGEGTVGLL